MSNGDHGRTNAQHARPKPETTASDFPLSDIEMELLELRATAAVLGHIGSEAK